MLDHTRGGRTAGTRLSSLPILVAALCLATGILPDGVPASWADPPAEESDEDRFPPFFSMVDLPRHHFFTGGNHGATAENGGHARDWKARRLDENGDWVQKYEEIADNPHCTNGEEGCDTYGDSIIYRVPVYAPADGKVLSCWRNIPNNPERKTSHPKRCCEELVDENGDCLIGACSKQECFDHTAPEVPVCPIRASGNYVLILTEDNHYLFAGHLAPGTIPEELCPFEEEFMENANTKACGATECSHLPAETIIPAAERPSVRRGDLIGRVGNTGASSGPHTHLHQGKMRFDDAGIPLRDGGHRPYLLETAWMRPAETLEWTKLEGWELKKTEENPQPLIKASPFHRTDTAIADPVEVITVAGAVTSVINAANELEVIAWDVAADGSVAQQQSSTGVQADLVGSTKLGKSRDVITAVRNANGNLRVDYWAVSGSGNVNHRDHRTAGAVGDLAVTRFPTGRGAIVAVKAGNDNLKLIAYAADSNDNLDRTSSIEGGAVRSVAVARVRQGALEGEAPSDRFLGVATASKTDSGRLRVETWEWDEAAQSLGQADALEAGTVLGQVTISTISLPGDRQMLVTAARTTDGMLLQTWSVDSSGVLEELSSHLEGDARHITINAISESRFATSFEDGDGNLKVRGWSLDADGAIGRLGDARAGAISRVASSRLRRDGGATRLILTAMRDDQERLRLIVFDTAL